MLVTTGRISLGGTVVTGGKNESMTVEAGRANNSAGTVTGSLNDPDLRQIAGIPNPYSQISFFDFYGKSSTISLVIGANAQNVNLYTLAGSPVFAKKIILTINAGVYIGSTSTSLPALNIGTGWPNGTTITIINNGYILGAGGNGGNGGSGGAGSAGSAGGPAMNLTWPVTITNVGYIFGGGGGGGGTASYSVTSCFPPGTKISTPDGLVNIEDLHVSDSLYAFDITTDSAIYNSTLVSRPITAVHVHKLGEEGFTPTLLKITHEFGTLTVTPNHEILTPSRTSTGSDKGFARAEDLIVGDLLVTADGTQSAILTITTQTGFDTVYNFSVEEHHSYVADNIRVHNGTYNSSTKKGSSTSYYGGSGGGGGAGYNAGGGGSRGLWGTYGNNGNAGSTLAGGSPGGGGNGSAGTGGAGGGAAGKAINLNGNTIAWTTGNNGTQVKGVVS